MASKIKMFNAGDRIKEPISYSLPETYGDVHAIARWVLDAPANSFFPVPTELKLPSGEAIPVKFAWDIVRKFGHRGVILIDADEFEGKTIEEDQPFATNDEEAQEKGKMLWRSYLESIARMHLDQCAEARAKGGAPRPAQGFTKRALKLLGQPDPGEELFARPVDVASVKSGEVEAMKAQVAAMQSLMSQQAQQMSKLMAQIERQRQEAIEVLEPEAEEAPRTGKKK